MTTNEHAVHFSGVRMTSGKLTVGCWKSDMGCQLRQVVYCLMEGGCRLLEVATSNTVSVIHTTTSAVRLLLTDQRTHWLPLYIHCCDWRWPAHQEAVHWLHPNMLI